jgi:hypothetical protein
MARLGLLLGFGVCAAGLLCSCGESQDKALPSSQTLGGVKEGAPLGRPAFDPGIMQDATTYQPAKTPSSSTIVTSAAPTEKRAAAAEGGGDAEQQVKTMVRDLVNALKDGEADLALRMFNGDEVSALNAKVDALLNTFEKIDLLGRLMRDKLKLDDATVVRLLGPLRGADTGLKWDLLDAEHATLTPDPAAILFGPAKAPPALSLTRQGAEWKFQLGAPLSEADVDAIVTYQQQLQTALDQIIDWLDSTGTTDEAEITANLEKAVNGEPLELEGTAEGERPEAGAKPKAKAPPAKAGEKPSGEGPKKSPPRPREREER